MTSANGPNIASVNQSESLQPARSERYYSRFLGVCGSSPAVAHAGLVLLLGREVNSKSIGVSVDLFVRNRVGIIFRDRTYARCRNVVRYAEAQRALTPGGKRRWWSTQENSRGSTSSKARKRVHHVNAVHARAPRLRLRTHSTTTSATCTTVACRRHVFRSQTVHVSHFCGSFGPAGTVTTSTCSSTTSTGSRLERVGTCASSDSEPGSYRD